MLLVDKNEKISKKDVQVYVNQKLTWGGGIYLLNKETICKGLLISIRETTERANSDISVFA